MNHLANFGQFQTNEIFPLAYVGYLIWIIAGWLDFRCHRKTDIAHTSGLAESKSHLWELGILAVAVFIFLALQVNAAQVTLLTLLVVAHAIAGHIDSTIAFTRHRIVSPWEQWIHSILNMAPWVALVWLSWFSWPEIGWTEPGSWRLHARDIPFSPLTWTAVLTPPILVNAIPAFREYVICRRVVSSARSVRLS
jgi:hypothetical protein